MMFEFDVVDETWSGDTISDALRGWTGKKKGIELPFGADSYNQGAIGNLCVFTAQERLYFFIPTLPDTYIACSCVDKSGKVRDLNGKYPCLLIGHAGNTKIVKVIA